ncbi:cysteine-rich DPF motif domain-containing protein 1 [Drosophila tropicalis]|uniref:cysteine-rich DPF motif domain-containing protein 1 n=1 Tax=Drosophila tropicalis TaxID=46794 RepID=UPI0035ABC5EF
MDQQSSTSQKESLPGEEEDSLLLPLDTEAAEIARLQPNSTNSQPDNQTAEEDDERIAKIQFRCYACDMREMVHYYGREPPFALGIEFREDTYVMRDPFQAPPPRWQSKPEFFISLGVHCCICSQVVCKDPACSYYYTQTYCLPCGSKELKSWPPEAQMRLRKQLEAANKKREKPQ